MIKLQKTTANSANKLQGIMKRILKFNSSEWDGTYIEFYEILDIWWLLTFKAKKIEFGESVTRYDKNKSWNTMVANEKVEFY